MVDIDLTRVITQEFQTCLNSGRKCYTTLLTSTIPLDYSKHEF